jgi:hypothetical protein
MPTAWPPQTKLSSQTSKWDKSSTDKQWLHLSEISTNYDKYQPRLCKFAYDLMLYCRIGPTPSSPRPEWIYTLCKSTLTHCLCKNDITGPTRDPFHCQHYGVHLAKHSTGKVYLGWMHSLMSGLNYVHGSLSKRQNVVYWSLKNDKSFVIWARSCETNILSIFRLGRGWRRPDSTVIEWGHGHTADLNNANHCHSFFFFI